MFGIRTPDSRKHTTNDAGSQRSPAKAMTHASNVRRSIGEWENTGKNNTPPSSQPPETLSVTTNLRQTQSQERKILATRRPSIEVVTSPPKPVKYINKTAEARACLNKAKLHLNNSRNLKSEIKTEVTQAIDRLYNIVKELDEDKKGRGGTEKEKPAKMDLKDIEMNREIMDRMEEHTKMLRENNTKIEELKTIMEEQRGNLEKMTYASIAASNPDNRLPNRSALHSIVVTSEKATDSGDAVLNKVREAIDAKEGWVKVERVRKARDRKIIMSCSTKEERDKVKDRLEKANKNLIVEDIKNKDPLIILKDVLLVNSDEDVLRAMKNQNKSIFQGLDEGEDRVVVKYRRKARNPHTGHIVVSTSPKIWRRVVNAGALHIDLQYVRVADQSPLVQCSRCLGYGHTKRVCKETADLCSHCGGPHLRTECADWLAGVEPACRNCSKAGLGRAEHNVFSSECPIRKKWDTLARSAIAYC